MHNKLYNEGYLELSNLHKIWYGCYGNPNGYPILWLHGGPGCGCACDDYKYFDTNFYKVILLDQRGAGKSKPFCELAENNTHNLVSDIEMLRKHLDIDKWSILGGSWGSLLALCYAIKHHDRINGLILRGVFTGTSKESHHLWYGMRDTFPEAWQELHDFLPENERQDIAASYARRVLDDDQTISMPAIRAFVKYDDICAYHDISYEALESNLNDETAIVGLAKIFMHYFINHFFIDDSYIMDNLASITHLPCFIIHGRYDTICKPSVAYDVHKAWPGSVLNIVPKAGHTARESEIEKALCSATEALKVFCS